MSAIIGIIIGLLSLGLMMILHELGHFLVGLKLGFKVIEFSIFMGPRLFSKEINGIRYSLKLLPIGASVQFAGEYPESEDELDEGKRAEGYFYAMPIWKRALVIFAGPFVNIVTAFLALIIYFNIIGVSVPTIRSINDNSLLQDAGVKVGDTLLSIDGHQIKNEIDLLAVEKLSANKANFEVKYIDQYGKEQNKEITKDRFDKYLLGIVIDNSEGHIKVKDLSQKRDIDLKAGDIITKVENQLANQEVLARILEEKKGAAINLTILRNNVEKNISVEPIVLSNQIKTIGANLSVEKNFLKSIPYSFNYSTSIVKTTFQLLGQVFTGGIKASQAIAGPVGIVDMYSNLVSKEGIDWGLKALELLYLFALISLSLGVMNLLPIPPLDGSILLFLLIEKIRGKKLSSKAMGIISMIGVIIILALAVLALGFDINRIIRR